MAPNRPFVVDPVLTAIAVGYRNDAQTLIADRVLPRVEVGGEKFKWTEYPIEESFNLPDTRVGRRGRVNQLEFNGTEKDDSVDDHGLETAVPNSDIDAAARAREEKRSTYDPEGHSTMRLMDTVLNVRESRVATLVQTLGNYAATRRTTLAGTSQFSDYANSTPISVIKTGLEGTLVYRPNTAVMGQAVWSKLSSHPEIVNAIRGNLTNKGIVTRQEFAALFELKEVLVGEGWVNTAQPGQAVNLQRAWGKHLSLLYIDPMARPEANGGITFGMTAQYGGRISGRIEDPDVGLQGGARIRTGERVKELIVAKDVGYFLQNAVA